MGKEREVMGAEARVTRCEYEKWQKREREGGEHKKK
jgi:hypothetical protein